SRINMRRWLCEDRHLRDSMRIEVSARPFSRAPARAAVPKFQSEIRRAQHLQAQKKHRAARQFRNRNLFQPVCRECLARDSRGGQGALIADLILVSAHLNKLQAMVAQQKCRSQSANECTLLYSVSRKQGLQ